MDIDKLTIGEARELAKMFACASTGDAGSEYVIGEKYLIRTVTFTTVGKVVRRTATALVLDDASWVADTGRFSTALAFGGAKLKEVERRGDGVIVSLGSIVDADVWRHDLPQETK